MRSLFIPSNRYIFLHTIWIDFPSFCKFFIQDILYQQDKISLIFRMLSRKYIIPIWTIEVHQWILSFGKWKIQTEIKLSQPLHFSISIWIGCFCFQLCICIQLCTACTKSLQHFKLGWEEHIRIHTWHHNLDTGNLKHVIKRERKELWK